MPAAPKEAEPALGRGHLPFHKPVWGEPAAAEGSRPLCHLFFFLPENHVYASNDAERQPTLPPAAAGSVGNGAGLPERQKG